MNRIDDSNSITLTEWYELHYDEDSIMPLKLGMDSAMRYIHEKGCYITSFDPNNIHILNGSYQQIKFDNLAIADGSNGMQMRDIIRENISDLSDIGVGIHCHFPDQIYINKGFLKSNFDMFEIYLPEGDVPYYKGIFERGAGVYYNDYIMEKRRRDLEELEKEVNGTSTDYSNGNSLGMGNALVKSNGHSLLGKPDPANTKINDGIYGQLGRRNDNAAYVSFFIVPLIVAMIGVIFAVLVLLTQF